MNNQTIKIRNMQTINNITEQTGRSPYIGENGNWFEFNDETQSFVDSGVLAKGIKGEKGDKGDTGEQGVQGEKGEKGDKGDKGEVGSSGLNGKDGITPSIGYNENWFLGDVDTGKPSRGIQGEQGIQGEKGDKGDKGDTGEQGIQGENGKDALINGVNVLNLLAGDNIELEQDNNNLVIKAIVINNLTTINDTAALSATQGKILKDSLDSLNDTIGNINTILSTLTTVEEVSE